MKRHVVPLVALVVANAAIVVASAVPAAAASVCPPDPPPGQQLQGPIEVTGTCVLRDVSVNGSINVESGAALELERVSVFGDITVQPGGALYVGHVVNTGIATYNQSVINGSVVLNNALDADLNGAVINGAVTVNGIRAPFVMTICGSAIAGPVSVSRGGILLGDPDADQFLFWNGVPCTGNSIRGSVTLSNIPPPSALFFASEVEGNVIRGSVTISASAIALERNTILGDVLCSAGGSVTGDEEPLSSNSISGTFAC